jgi:hypothetical protein
VLPVARDERPVVLREHRLRDDRGAEVDEAVGERRERIRIRTHVDERHERRAAREEQRGAGLCDDHPAARGHEVAVQIEREVRDVEARQADTGRDEQQQRHLDPRVHGLHQAPVVAPHDRALHETRDRDHRHERGGGHAFRRWRAPPDAAQDLRRCEHSRVSSRRTDDRRSARTR